MATVVGGYSVGVWNTCTCPSTTTSTTTSTTSTTTLPPTTTTTTTTTTLPPTSSTTTTTEPPAGCIEVGIYPPLVQGTTHTVTYIVCPGGTQNTVNVPYGGNMIAICTSTEGIIYDNKEAVVAQTYPTGYPCSGDTTTTTTTTTTTQAPPATGNMYINNYNSPGTQATITAIEVNGVSVTLSSGSFPVGPGQTATAVYTPAPNSSVLIYSSHGADTPVSVSTNNGYLDCIISAGYADFTGIDLSAAPSVNVYLDLEGSACQ
jgi:hypothetical protein